MEPDKDTPPQINRTTEASSSTVPSAETPSQPARTTSKNIVRDILVTVGVVAALGLGFSMYAVLSVSKAVSNIPSGCDARTNRIQAGADKLKKEINTLNIDGVASQSIRESADKDCVDGSGDISATADFSIQAPDVTTANAEIIKNLDLAPNQPTQVFNTDNNGNEAYNLSAINFVTTKLKTRNGNTYTIEYWLTTPQSCASEKEQRCQTDLASIQTYNLMQKPIDKVTIILAGHIS